MKVLFIFIIFIISSKVLTAKNLANQLGRPDKWFNSLEGMEAIKNILSHQSTIGIWPKNINTAVKKHSGKKDSIEGTFDNSATLNELRILAKAFNATQKRIYKKSFLKGLECILESQYENGGWPQRPHSSGYEQHITFNDGTMVGIMQFMQEYSWDQKSKIKLIKNLSRDFVDSHFFKKQEVKWSWEITLESD